jgi:hypothetical protein
MIKGQLCSTSGPLPPTAAKAFFKGFFKAFSSEVDTGSREEKRVKMKSRPVLLKRFLQAFSGSYGFQRKSLEKRTEKPIPELARGWFGSL